MPGSLFVGLSGIFFVHFYSCLFPRAAAEMIQRRLDGAGHFSGKVRVVFSGAEALRPFVKGKLALVGSDGGAKLLFRKGTVGVLMNQEA